MKDLTKIRQNLEFILPNHCKKYGFLKGFILSSKRIFSCHPFGPYGYKPLAESEIPLVKKISAKEIQYERKFHLYKNLPENFSKYNEDDAK